MSNASHFLNKWQVRIEWNFSKCLFIYISKTVPRDEQANESNFGNIKLWRISHANENTKIYSKETLVAKELALVITDTNTAEDVSKIMAACGPLWKQVCEEGGGEGEKYNNFSNILRGITRDYGWLCMEQ